MTIYFISPYDPSINDATYKSDLHIEPDEYKERLLSDWPGTTFLPPAIPEILLTWTLPSKEEGFAGMYGELNNDHQTVAFGFDVDFILWHRRLISAAYRLFLYNESSWKGVELKIEMTTNDIFNLACTI